jgi:hypothetical protein
MPSRILTTAMALALCLAHVEANAQRLAQDLAQDQVAAQYPSFKGQWVRIGGGGQFDPDKPPVRGQQPPLTDEYKAIWEQNIADARAGSQYYNTTVRCMYSGMPRMMTAFEPMEVIVLPEITYIHLGFNNEFRRIYSDGRDFPADEETSFSGYSIGKWVDDDNDGKYDALEVETRNLRGPRIFDTSGIPLHKDNKTIVKERIYLDPANPNILRDQITVIDNALTRPWTVTRSYRRADKTRWIEHSCGESNIYVFIEGQTYLIGLDGKLEPSRKDQSPPDLRHFQK